jgi:hypothetical protein
MILKPGKLYECIRSFDTGKAENASNENGECEEGTVLMFIKGRPNSFSTPEEELVFLHKEQVVVSMDRRVDRVPSQYLKEIDL